MSVCFFKTWDTLCRRGRRCCQQWHLWRRGGIQCQDRRWVGIFNSDTFSTFQHVQSILSPHGSSVPAFELQNISMKCQIIFTFVFACWKPSLDSLPRAHWKRNYITLVLALWPVSYHRLQHPEPLRAKDLDSSICNPFNWRRCFYPIQCIFLSHYSLRCWLGSGRQMSFIMDGAFVCGGLLVKRT